MKQSPFQGFDPLYFTLGTLLFLALLGQSIASISFGAKSVPFFIYEIVSECIMGLYFLYGGIKKLRQRREQQEQAYWYTQPGILIGIGAFFLIPYWVLAIIFGTDGVDRLPVWVQIVLFAPAVICLLASGFFFFRRLLFFRRV